MKCIACDQWEAVHDGGLCDLCKAEGMPTWYDLRDELTGALAELDAHESTPPDSGGKGAGG